MRSDLAPLRGLALAAALLALPPAAAASLVELEPVVQGLDRPLLVTHAGDGSGRLFVVEQAGRVWIVEDGARSAEPFLDLVGRTRCCGEQGLLGLAFHPDYAANGRLFVNYTAPNGDTVVSRFTVSSDPDRADDGSEAEILRIDQPFSNHNGGHLAFGPDGYLYLASGDGGSGGDPRNNAQSLDTLLGKILRIDVDSGSPYAVPSDNPFVGQPGAAEEIWAYGLRNPWRFSFDRETGDLYLGDVGQGRIEEIDFQPAASRGGENYGWRIREGSACFEPPTACAQDGLVPPVLEYRHDQGCSVTAGHRYRGPAAPTLDRFFLYGDFCSGRIWGGRPNLAGNWRARELVDTSLSISSFGEDEAGRLYVADLGGGVYRLVGEPRGADDFEAGDLSRWARAVGSAGVTEVAGGFALEVPVEGEARKSFVRTNRPQREESLEVCLSLFADGLDDEGAPLKVLELRGRKALAQLRLEPGRRHRLALWARGADGLERAGSMPLKRRKPTELCLEWASATSGAAADGEALLTRKGRVRAKATGLANRGEAVRSLQLGLPGGSAGVAAGGRLLVDDVVVTP